MSVTSLDSEDGYADSSDVQSDREPLLAGQAKSPGVRQRPQPQDQGGRTVAVEVNVTSNGSTKSPRKEIPLANMAAGGTGKLGQWA